jgi:MFS family permease
MASRPDDKNQSELERRRGRGRLAVDLLELAGSRTIVGPTRSGPAVPFREGLRDSAVGIYPVAALGLLVVVDQFMFSGFQVLGPNIAGALHLPLIEFGSLVQLQSLALVLAVLPMALLVQRRPRRALVALVTAYLWSAATTVAGFAFNAASLATLLVLDGATSAAVISVHVPLLMDTYADSIRVRIISIWTVCRLLSGSVAPLVVALLAGPFHLDYRMIFLVAGAVCLAVSAFSSRLRDPGFGHSARQRDSARAAAHVNYRTGPGTTAAPPHVEVPALDRLFGRRSFLLGLAAVAFTGAISTPLQIYLSFLLERRYGQDASSRGLVFATFGVSAALAVIGFAPLADRLLKASPARLFTVNAALQFLTSILLVAAPASGNLYATVAGFALAIGLFSALGPGMYGAILGVIHAQLRPHANACLAITQVLFGGVVGLGVLGAIEPRLGIEMALGALAVPSLLAAATFLLIASVVNRDVREMQAELAT